MMMLKSGLSVALFATVGAVLSQDVVTRALALKLNVKPGRAVLPAEIGESLLDDGEQPRVVENGLEVEAEQTRICEDRQKDQKRVLQIQTDNPHIVYAYKVEAPRTAVATAELAPGTTSTSTPRGARAPSNLSTQLRKIVKENKFLIGGSILFIVLAVVFFFAVVPALSDQLSYSA